MASESSNVNDRICSRISPRLPAVIFLLVALIIWVKNQAVSTAHLVQAGDESNLRPEPGHPIPFAHWDVFDGDGTEPPEYYWGKDDYKPLTGTYSAWCARDGASGLDPEFWLYPNNADSRMVYGPFSLANYDEAVLEYYYWNKSEEDFDYFHYLASFDGVYFRGGEVSGDSGGWLNDRPLDLSQVPQLGDLTGLPSVWIAFRFTSDDSTVDEGAFIDDIVLRAKRPGSDEWEILMSEDFEDAFPPMVETEFAYVPVVLK